VKFTEEQIERYSRHIILKEVGGKGQQKIAESRILCIGAGGLGSPAAMYLAAAGVGRLGIVDADAVDLSNLHRQILHTTAGVNTPKVDSARERLSAINPDVDIRTHPVRLSSENVMDIIADYDILVDGSDNFPTRFLVNDAAFFKGKTLVSASIFRFEGQLTTLKPAAGFPCYRCLYPEPPPPGMVPSCQEAGVLGVLAGTVGVLQAAEALKEVLQIGTPLYERLLIYDALEMRFRTVKTRKDPDCPLCGPSPRITRLLDYEQSCTI
jgi:molybdopterin/thiamine biosynthesis adenylyltransferase